MRLLNILKGLVMAWVVALLGARVVGWWWVNGLDSALLAYGVAISSMLFLNFSVAFALYRDPYQRARRDPAALAKTPLVTCMVAVRNERAIIEKCLASLLGQTYPNTEIIIVDDQSTDGTGDILDRYARRGLIRVIHLDTNLGKKRALGRAMLLARGEIFAFSDSDSAWAPDALAKIVPIFNHDARVGGVGGHCRALNAQANLLTRMQDTWYEGQFSVRKAFESAFGVVTCVSGPLAVFRRAAVYNYIPAWEADTFLGQEFRFATDRTLTGFVLGGREVGPRLKQKYAESPFVRCEDHPPQRWKVLYCKSARAWTQVPDTWHKLMRQQIRWKKSFIRNIFFTGAFFWRKPLLPAIEYYLQILFVLAGPFVSFRYLVLSPLQGDLLTPALYLAGVLAVGLCFGLACLGEDRRCKHWYLRPLMSLLSTLVLSWVVFYSALTIRRMIWARG
jgi:cellulose synthase/poly-beta-1,6-N-acetylglucosamine synthase-like glycosyltransferase